MLIMCGDEKRNFQIQSMHLIPWQGGFDSPHISNGNFNVIKVHNEKIQLNKKISVDWDLKAVPFPNS